MNFQHPLPLFHSTSICGQPICLRRHRSAAGRPSRVVGCMQRGSTFQTSKWRRSVTFSDWGLTRRPLKAISFDDAAIDLQNYRHPPPKGVGAELRRKAYG